MELHDRLKYLIDLTGASEREIAELSGLSPQAINFLGSGQRDNPTLKTLRGIAGVFGVSLDWLGDGLGERPTKDAVVRSFNDARAAAPDPRDASAARDSHAPAGQ